MAKKSRVGLIHCIAICSDCEWREEDFKKAVQKGREHNEKTGHEVVIEMGTTFTYYWR
jgi:hypothetical protein